MRHRHVEVVVIALIAMTLVAMVSASPVTALGHSTETGDYAFVDITRPNGEAAQVAFVRYRGEWLVADM